MGNTNLTPIAPAAARSDGQAQSTNKEMDGKYQLDSYRPSRCAQRRSSAKYEQGDGWEIPT